MDFGWLNAIYVLGRALNQRKQRLEGNCPAILTCPTELDTRKISESEEHLHALSTVEFAVVNGQIRLNLQELAQ
jgi:hypothetical protein